MVDCKELKAQLDELRRARMQLVSGKAVVTVIDQNGERIEFQKVRLADLDNLIRQMEIEFNSFCGMGNSAYRPMRVYF